MLHVCWVFKTWAPPSSSDCYAPGWHTFKGPGCASDCENRSTTVSCPNSNDESTDVGVWAIRCIKEQDNNRNSNADSYAIPESRCSHLSKPSTESCTVQCGCCVAKARCFSGGLGCFTYPTIPTSVDLITGGFTCTDYCYRDTPNETSHSVSCSTSIRWSDSPNRVCSGNTLTVSGSYYYGLGNTICCQSGSSSITCPYGCTSSGCKGPPAGGT